MRSKVGSTKRRPSARPGQRIPSGDHCVNWSEAKEKVQLARPESIAPSRRQTELQKELSRAIDAALLPTRRIEELLIGPQSPYKRIAEVLVELRHEFRGPNGQPHDLRGRSAGYRVIVRSAYLQAGADPKSALSKRLTAGTAYWVRKILIERYGKPKLFELGIIPLEGVVPTPEKRSKSAYAGKDKLGELQEAVGVLNGLASDPEMVPTEEILRAAIRAVNLLSLKLDGGRPNRFKDIAV